MMLFLTAVKWFVICGRSRAYHLGVDKGRFGVQPGTAAILGRAFGIAATSRDFAVGGWSVDQLGPWLKWHLLDGRPMRTEMVGSLVDARAI